MKLSSLIIIVLVVFVFVFVQGWVVLRKFDMPQEVKATEAVITGRVVEVTSPSSGVIQEIRVTESQKVEEGALLFMIEPYYHSEPVDEKLVEVVARRSGVITDIRVEEGSFVQASGTLSNIVDVNPENLHVKAKIAVEPDKLSYIKPVLNALVWAEYLNNGQPMEAVVDSIDPVYDAKEQTIDVKLRLVSLPDELDSLPLGVPVDVSIQVETDSPLRKFFQRVNNKLASFFQNQQS